MDEPRHNGSTAPQQQQHENDRPINVTPPESDIASESTISEDDLEALKVLERVATMEKEAENNGVELKSKNGTQRRPTQPLRQGSMTLRLEKADIMELLTADDPEVRRILREGLERKSSKNWQRGFRNLRYEPRFSAFDRLNPVVSSSPYRGFFVLVWMSIAFLLIKAAIRNQQTHGNLFGESPTFRMMFSKDFGVLVLTNAAMYGCTAFGLVIQKLCFKGYIDWQKYGWFLQHLWQAFYLSSTCYWVAIREWEWQPTIWTVLLLITLLMKSHSYSSYNGYLSHVFKRRRTLEKKLIQLKNTSATKTSELASDVNDHIPSASTLRQRRSSTSKQDLAKESLEVSKVIKAMSGDKPLSQEQLDAFTEIIEEEIDQLSQQLQGNCESSKGSYPANLTAFNWFEWSLFPTLCYHLDYPRTDRINWSYVFEKSCAVFGVIGIMVGVSESFIFNIFAQVYPLQQTLGLYDRLLLVPSTFGELLFPIMLEHLLSFYVIFECVLNVMAELSRYSDRNFYDEWWESSSFEDYARRWNKPVSAFLRRHVYDKISKKYALVVTFFLSAVFHELTMISLFRKVRFYLFGFQLLQIPLIAMGRLKIFRKYPLLGNVFFLFGIYVGPALLATLYLLI